MGLRENSVGEQDWYESRDGAEGGDATLLTLYEDPIDNNSTKKGALKNHDIGKNAYLTQDFGSPQSGMFGVSFEIYIDRIALNAPDATHIYNRTGFIFIGDNSEDDDADDSGKGPNSTGSNRFVYMAFYSPDGGGDSSGDTMNLIASEPGNGFNDSSEWRVVASDLSFDAWHTIRAVGDLNTDTYEVYVNDDPVPQATVTAYTAKTSVTHISFAQWDDGAGAFYVDDVADASFAVFAAGFGRTGCTGICLGDDDGDGDLDGTDIAAYAAALASACP